MAKPKIPSLSNETAEQEAVVEFCDLLHIPVVHIPNEGKRSKSYGAQLKRAGMRSGFPDLFLPIARNGYHGLFIEMKYGKGKVSAEQAEWLTELTKQGYATCVCYGATNAIQLIKSYMGMAGRGKSAIVYITDEESGKGGN